MRTKLKQLAALFLSLSLILGGISVLTPSFNDTTFALEEKMSIPVQAPKYIFLFIGDGMTFPQFTAASSYLGTKNTGDKRVEDKKLEFMKFPVVGTATTFDSSSFCPDSASTATSISTGFKTLSGVINMNEQKNLAYEAISETLKKEKKYKIGVVSSVPLNHATPAAFYAHQPSRNNYYEIGREMITSNFDYFGGGGLIASKGKDNNLTDLRTLAKNAGYKVVENTKDILALNTADKKVIAMNQTLVGDALPYEIDRKSDDLSLADFTRKGIDVLYNTNGFFMMVEGGKIDWACHANDAAASIHDTIAFDNAVQEAIKFYNKHPNDTLILVTGDHETGGMSIGYAGTKYSTYLNNLGNQKMSGEAFDLKVAEYRNKKTNFETVLMDIERNFGLLTSNSSSAKSNPAMVLTEDEIAQLKTAYESSLSEKSNLSKNQFYLEYGGYEPLSIAVTHLLNNKSGIGWTSYSHTGLPAAVFAKGLGAERFNGSYDNTELYFKLKELTKIKN